MEVALIPAQTFVPASNPNSIQAARVTAALNRNPQSSTTSKVRSLGWISMIRLRSQLRTLPSVGREAKITFSERIHSNTH